MRTELEIFAKHTLDHGGEWWLLEEGNKYSLYSCKSTYMDRGRKFYNSPVYQIFDYKGKRIDAILNYREAYNKFQRLERDTCTK